MSTITCRVYLDSPSAPDAGFYLLVTKIPTEYDDKNVRESQEWTAHPVEMAAKLAATSGLDLPEKPSLDRLLDDGDSMPDSTLKPLKSDEDWQLACLQSKVSLSMPETLKLPKRSDVLGALSTATGYTIICEDFRSHMCGRSAVNGNFGADATVKSVLQTFDTWSSFPIGLGWLLDEHDKVLIGWNIDWKNKRDIGWKKMHRELVPEKIITNLVEKTNGPGADLDDLSPLSELLSDQMSFWIRPTKGLNDVQTTLYEGDIPLWQLYNALSPKDKALAKTKAGLPLGKFDPNWIISFIDQSRRNAENYSIALQPLQWDHHRNQKLAVFNSPALVAALVLRVERKPLEFWNVRVIKNHRSKFRSVYANPKLQKYEYQLTLSGEKDGQPFEIGAVWNNPPFPVFTPEKEAELRCQAGIKI